MDFVDTFNKLNKLYEEPSSSNKLMFKIVDTEYIDDLLTIVHLKVGVNGQREHLTGSLYIEVKDDDIIIDLTRPCNKTIFAKLKLESDFKLNDEDIIILVKEYINNNKKRIELFNKAHKLLGESALQETDNEGNILSKEQINFFKDSKVRDNQGRLMVMYHGTPNATFKEFKNGTFFTPNKSYASNYTRQGASYLGYKQNADKEGIYSVYLNMKKPFDTRLPKERNIFKTEYLNKWGTGSDLSEKTGLPDWMDSRDLIEFLAQNYPEYDGLLLDEGGYYDNDGNVMSRGISYISLDSTQIKSTTNKNPSNAKNIDEDLAQKQEDFFKNSKVRDEHGELVICYHGTHTPGFKEFDSAKGDSKFGKYKYKQKYNVNYFTTDRKSAASYTEFGYEDEEQGNVYACYLNIVNPYVVSNKTKSAIKSSFNIKDDALRKHQIELFNKIFNKWKDKTEYYFDRDDLEELNDDLHVLNLEMRPDGGHYYSLYKLGNNSRYGLERPIELQYEVEELFSDDMYDQLKEDILGINDKYGEDDYFFSTDDVVRFVLDMNETKGTNYDGIIVPDIVDSMDMFSMPGVDYITLKSSNQIKLISNENPTASNRIDESDTK